MPSTSAALGVLGPFTYSGITSSSGNNTFLNNNVWDSGSASSWSQTLTATDPGSWNVVANIVSANPGAVISYPDVQQLYGERPLSSFSSITVSWAETMNVNGSSQCEAAFDCWFNHFHDEVMVWVDCTASQIATLAFDTNVGTFLVDGKSYTLYHRGTSTEWIFLLNEATPTGTIDLLALFNLAASQGAMPLTSGITAIEFGWEIATTGGHTQTFDMTHFTITEVSAIPVLLPVNMNGNQVTNAAPGVSPSDYATIAQLESAAGGGVALRAVSPAVFTLTDNTTVTVDATKGNVARWVLGANGHTISVPTALSDGQIFILRIIYGGTFTPGFAAGWNFGSVGQPTWTSVAGTVDETCWRYNADANGGAGVLVYLGSEPLGL